MGTMNRKCVLRCGIRWDEKCGVTRVLEVRNGIALSNLVSMCVQFLPSVCCGKLGF